MLDATKIATALHAKSDADTARKRGRHLQPLRGIRGTPVAEITRVIAEAWRRGAPRLPADEDALSALFFEAWEDGLAAIGLLAPVALKSPLPALDLVDRWLASVDDVDTADALGWYVLGPALRAAAEPLPASLTELAARERPHARRAAVMALMAWLPEPVTGPAAAALREASGTRDLALAESADDALLAAVLSAFVRDEDPHVRKAVARVGRCWAEVSPDPAEAWLNGVRGGVPKTLREEVEKGLRRGRRPARERAPRPDGG